MITQPLSKPDILDVVSQHVSLRRAGKQYVGLCPLHQEKTPSFTVNPERQTFHCYGCHESGDVISFVQAYKDLSFKEALVYLNIDTPSAKPKTRKQRIQALLEQNRRLDAELQYRLYLRTYSQILAERMRNYNHTMLLRYNFEWEEDAAIEHLPELFRKCESMEEAEFLVFWMRLAQEWSREIEIIHGRDEEARLELYRRKLYDWT